MVFKRPSRDLSKAEDWEKPNQNPNHPLIRTGLYRTLNEQKPSETGFPKGIEGTDVQNNRRTSQTVGKLQRQGGWMMNVCCDSSSGVFRFEYRPQSSK